jgi:hypothetical protein
MAHWFGKLFVNPFGQLAGSWKEFIHGAPGVI